MNIRRGQDRADRPETFEFRGETYVKVDDLRRLVGRHRNRAVDHGYINALHWVMSVLKELQP